MENMDYRNSKKQLPRKTILMIMERIMKRDALLQPYFEDGSIKVVDRPEEDFISFKPGAPGKIRKFVLDRIRTLRRARPEEWDIEKFAEWQKREEMIKVAEEDEVLAWYFKEGYLRIENTAGKGSVWMDDELPEEEKRRINKKIMEIWVGEEIDDDVAEEMAKVLIAQHAGKPSSGPEVGVAIRELVIEALREDEMIAEYIENGLIKLNTDPTRNIWEIDKSVSMGEVGILHNQGIYIMMNRFGINPYHDAQSHNPG